MTRAPGQYNRGLGLLRLVAVWLLVGAMVALARPTPAGVLAGISIAAVGEGLRLWSAGHLLKNDELVTAGPYRHTRNPLYLGRLLIFTGLCVMVRLPLGASWIVLALGYAVFFLYYLPRKERVEPTRLRELHGESYERYRRAVPALLPRLIPYEHASPRRWSISRMLGNREHWMVLGLLAVGGLLLWRAYSI